MQDQDRHRRQRQPGIIGLRMALLCAALSLAGPALAQPERIALLLSNGDYANLPPLPACRESSAHLASALRALGYQVTTREDVSSGGLSAAIGQLGREMESHPQASVVLYFCGYAAGLNGRPFLLPASANLRRASDAMTQGILAKALLDLVARGNPSRGLIAFDTAPTPDADGSSLGLESLAGLPAPEGVGVIAVTEPRPAQGPSPLSRALTEALGSPDVRVAELVAQVAGALARAQTTHVAVALEPALSRPLAADEAPPPPPPAPAPVEPEPEPAPPPPAAPEPDPAPAEPPVSMPDEGEMTTDQRRSVQAALKRIGYYGAEVDGLFGPETRAAIRRFQHEIGAPTTGTITGEQASRLIDLN